MLQLQNKAKFTTELCLFPDENAINLPYSMIKANSDMDQDENLTWPNLTKLQVNWQNINDRNKKGRRYSMGETRPQAFLEKQIAQGSQRCRNIAVVHLTLLDPVTPFVNARIQALV